MKLVRVSGVAAQSNPVVARTYYPIADNRGLVFGYLKKAQRKSRWNSFGIHIYMRGFASAKAVVAAMRELQLQKPSKSDGKSSRLITP